MGFSENLRNELDFQDLQVQELANKTGISKNTLDKYLSQSRKIQPGIEKAVRIARALGVSVEYLVTGETSGTSTLREKQYIAEYSKLSPKEQKAVSNLVRELGEGK